MVAPLERHRACLFLLLFRQGPGTGTWLGPPLRVARTTSPCVRSLLDLATTCVRQQFAAVTCHYSASSWLMAGTSPDVAVAAVRRWGTSKHERRGVSG